MFNNKLKERIAELERELRNEKTQSEKISANNAQTLAKITSDLETANRLIERLTIKRDVLLKERKEIKQKCENSIDKDSLITLLMMKNHDQELEIFELKNRLMEQYRFQIQSACIQQIPYPPGQIIYPFR